MLEHLKPFNLITCADGYKINHWLEAPEGDEYGYANMVPRKPSQYSTQIVSMGITLLSSIFASTRITMEMIDEAEVEVTEQGYTFNRKGWERIVRELDGKIPLAIYGVEEGRIVNPQTPIVGIINTVPNFAWLVTYFETFSQALVWKMSTVASVCRAMRLTLIEFCELTGTDTNNVNYMMVNFGDRGADGPHEAAVLAGIAHAALFDGSDCIRANGYIKKLYGTYKPSTSSIEASEHSVSCAHSDAENKDDWGAAVMVVDRLFAAVERYEQGFPGLPFMSAVIDTYDSRRFVKEYLGTRLKDRILEAAARGGRLIARPDSSDMTIEPGLVGKDWEATFGVTINDKGYKVLHEAVGVIQGDGVKVDTVLEICQGWVNAGFAMDNFCLGSGAGITHFGSRDDFSFSFKSTANFRYGRYGKWVATAKDPITDPGKKSLKGLVRCREDNNGELEVYDAITEGSIFSFLTESPGWRLWYKDGFREYRQSWDEVKSRARS